MKNSTSAFIGKFLFPVLSFFIALTGTAQTYSTAVGDWTNEWSGNSGTYQATNGPGTYSFGTTATDGQVSSRNFTSDGTTSGANTAMKVGQKLTITVAAPVGGGRTGIQSGGRIGFALTNVTSYFNGANAQARYFSDAMMRFEYQGGQSSAQLVDGTTTLSGLPGFTDFTNGITYEVEVISDKEYNFQVVGGNRFNVRSFSFTGSPSQISIANLGENRDGTFTSLAISDMTTVGLTANTGETFTVAGIISNKSNANTVTKSGAGTVILTGQSTYTGITNVTAGTLQLSGASTNTIRSGAAVSVSNGATLRISQDQTIGNLTLPAGANLVIDAGKTLIITGTYISGGNIQNNGSLVLSGSFPMSFPGSGTISAMNNLAINNASVTLDAASLNVTGLLRFMTPGSVPAVLTTGSNVISAASVSQASSVNGWVNGNLIRTISATGNTVFDIGDATNYLPVTLNVSPISFAAGTVQVSTRSGINTTQGLASLSLGTTNAINRVWSVTKPSGSTFGGGYAGTFTYLSADQLGTVDFGDLRQGVFNSTSWFYPGIVTRAGFTLTQSQLVVPMATNDIVFGSSQSVTISGITANSKIYDASTSATISLAGAQANGLLNGNAVTIVNSGMTGAFTDKNVGTGKTVNLTGAVVLGGQQAGAYKITSIQSSTTADINARPLEVTATANTKQYDGTTSAAAIPSVTSGAVQGSDVAAFTETYDTPNAGTGKTLTPAGIVNDGNGGSNYSYTFIATTNGIITNIPITNITATPGTINCSGGSTTLTITADGGDGQLSYSLSGPVNISSQSSNVFSGVTAGTYTVTVSDEDGFSAQLSNVVVTEPQTMTATYVVENQSSCGVTPDGSITVTPIGGTAPYSYTWTGLVGSNNPAPTPYTGGSNSATVSNLQYGFYNVNIADANGCNINVTDIHVKKNNLPPYLYFTSTISASCANTGSVTIYAQNGVAPYTYSVDGTNYQSSNTFTDLAVGAITMYAKDARGCVGTVNSNIISAAPLVAVPVAIAASACAADGSVKVNRSGGIPPFTFSIDGTNYTSNNLFTGLTGGQTYTVYVQDSKSCIGSTQVTIPTGAALSVSERHVATSSCIDDGSIQLIVTGGTAPYSYSIDGVNYQSGNSFSNLPAGTYTVSVQDSRSCTGSVNVTINVNAINLTAVVIPASSCASSNGTIKLLRSGGVAPFTFSLDGDNYQSSNVFTGLAAGTYTGYGKDSKTCVGQLPNIVVGPACRDAVARVQTPSTVSTQAVVYPNPSSIDFTLELGKTNVEKVQVSISDLSGRVLSRKMIAAGNLTKIGSELKPGVYFIEVLKGNEKQVIRIVKQ